MKKAKKGKVRKDPSFKRSKRYYVVWYHAPEKRTYKIYYYHGIPLTSEQMAELLLSEMRGDYIRGMFRIENYIGKGWSGVIPYLNDWIESAKPSLAPATYKDYSNSIRNHLIPFFMARPVKLQEINYGILLQLLNSIPRAGKGKLNVMYCLHACLKYAWRCGDIPAIPPFPEKKAYQIQEKSIKWLPEERQMAIINAIPEEHRPIFLWLKYHLRRPGEAYALHRDDYDSDNDVFIICRCVSSRKVIDFTKTHKEHIIPCHEGFHEIAQELYRRPSKYMFTCNTSRSDGKRYTDTITLKLWHTACKKVGEDIKMYAGLKHSSCSQYINEKGLSESELQVITDHARLDSVKKYAKTEVARKRELMRGKVVDLRTKSNYISKHN